MTFEEAVIFKKSLGYTKYTDSGIDYTVFIVPMDRIDFVAYLNVIRGWNELGDSDAIKFSKNNSYAIYGLSKSGFNVSFQEIKVDS